MLGWIFMLLIREKNHFFFSSTQEKNENKHYSQTAKQASGKTEREEKKSFTKLSKLFTREKKSVDYR